MLQLVCHSAYQKVANHGVSQELVKEVFLQSKAFFGLPEEDKLSLLVNKHGRGYTPLYEETLDAKKQTYGDTKVVPF